MKKQLLALAVLGTSIVSAQTWSEDFSTSTPPALPTGWAQNNVDGFTPNSAVSALNFGTNAWVTYNYSAGYPTHGKVVSSTSYYTSPATSNDWLITPQFTVPPNAVLQWDALAYSASYPDGYKVKISTTGTAVSNFNTTLYSNPGENTTWTTRAVSLNSYSNQVVYIAFVNDNNDMWLLFMDNIMCMVPPANDGNVASITGLTRYMAGAGNQNITGSFKNMGYSSATSAVLNYKVNGGATITQTISFGAIGYSQSTNYSFTTPANLALGANKIKTWVTYVNGVPETNHLNDTAYSVVYVASQGVQRAILVEEWSSSTCVPCANLNVNFDPLLNSNNPNTGGDVNVVKYQMNWPSPSNDPSYNNDGLDRRMHYDVNAIPDAYIDGTYNMSSHTQAELDAAKALPAFADITATITAKKSSTVTSVQTTIAAQATITPYVTITSNSPVRVYQALLENGYHFNSNSTTQHDFFHAMRKMSTNGWGTPTVITDGSPFTVSFNLNPTFGALDQSPTPIPAQFSFNFWTQSTTPATNNNIVYEYVVWLQDTVSNDVLQSGSWTASVTIPQPTVSVGMKELAANQQIGIFPNPAKEYATLSINVEKASKVDVTIYDLTGKMVYSNPNGSVNSGRNDMNINTSELPTGTYNVFVKTESGVLKDKLIISK